MLMADHCQQLHTVTVNMHCLPSQVPPITLKWDGLNCNLAQKDGSSRRLLVSCKGEARPGRYENSVPLDTHTNWQFDT
jgi:hypothetical protein